MRSQLFNQLAFFLLCFCLNSQISLAQTPKADSLNRELKKELSDTSRCKTLLALFQNEIDSVKRNDCLREVRKLTEKRMSELKNDDLEFQRLGQCQFKAILNLGVYLQRVGDLKLAEVYLLQSREVAKRSGYHKGEGYALTNIANGYMRSGELQRALNLYNEAIVIGREENDLNPLATAISNAGMIHIQLGNIRKGFEMYKTAHKIREEIGDLNGISMSLNNLAALYHDQGDIPRAIEYFSESLQVREKMSDDMGVAQSLLNLSVLYDNQQDYQKAHDYLYRSLKVFVKLKDLPGLSHAFLNLGAIYEHMHKLDSAQYYYEKALSSSQKLNDKQGEGTSLYNLGAVHEKKKENNKALEYYIKSLSVREAIQHKGEVSASLSAVARFYFNEGDMAQALNYAQRSYELARELKYPKMIKDASRTLYSIFKATGKSKEALNYFELYTAMSDSMNNESTRKASIRSQLKYEYEKQAAADSVAHAKESEIKNAELAKQQAEIKAKKNQQYALFGGLFCVCVFGIFMYNRFKVTQRQKLVIESQKELVEAQKELVEEKQKEILDSIQYARRIQMAQIPSESRIKAMLLKSGNHNKKT